MSFPEPALFHGVRVKVGGGAGQLPRAVVISAMLPTPLNRDAFVLSLFCAICLGNLAGQFAFGSFSPALQEDYVMSNQQTALTIGSIETPSGRISYAEAGSGPVALFVHGVVLNKHLWRHQLSGLADIRRCIAVDLLAHGDTEIEPNQDVSVTANATQKYLKFL
jgi:hypothetical protein